MKSISDTMKITNAMYMISSTKLQHAKSMLADTEPYFYSLQQGIWTNPASCTGDGQYLFQADFGGRFTE